MPNKIYKQKTKYKYETRDFNGYEVPIELMVEFSKNRSNKNKSEWLKLRDKLKEDTNKKLEEYAMIAPMMINKIANIYLMRGVGFLELLVLNGFQKTIKFVTKNVKKILSLNFNETNYQFGTTFFNENKGKYDNYNEPLRKLIFEINNFLSKRYEVMEEKDNKYEKYIFSDSELYREKNNPVYYATKDGKKYSFLGYFSRTDIENSEDNPIEDEKEKLKKIDSLDKIYNINKDNFGTYRRVKTDEPTWDDKQKEYLDKHGVEFFIEDINGGRSLYFENTIINMTDSTSVNWEDRRISGRPDSYKIYSGASRNGNLTFSILAGSRDGVNEIKEKIELLSNMCRPTFKNKRPVNPFLRITVGNFIKNQLIKMNSLLINPDEEMGWKIRKEDDELSFPYKLDITIDYTILYDKSPNYNGNTDKYFNN